MYQLKTLLKVSWWESGGGANSNKGGFSVDILKLSTGNGDRSAEISIRIAGLERGIVEPDSQSHDP